MEEFLKIGVIVKPQGIRGEVKIQPLTDDISRFKGIKTVFIDGEERKVLSVKIAPDAVFLALSGIADRNDAETYRGKYITVDRANAVNLAKGRYFIADIIGCTLKTDIGESVGEISEITSARTDIFTVKCLDGRVLRFPFLKDLSPTVDVQNKTVTVSDKRLKEVSCYED